MAVIVNVVQCNSIVDVQAPAGASTGAVADFAGPPINWSNRTVAPTSAVSWNVNARYAILTIISTGGIVYARSSDIDSPALAVGGGEAVTSKARIARNGSDTFLLLREHV